MPSEYRAKRRVEFAETDMAGIVHFANFFRYMEMTEHDFLRSLGLSVHATIDGRTISWPRIRAECSYRSPVTFEDELEVRLVVRAKTARTVDYQFEFYCHDKLVAHGSMTVVCASIEPISGRIASISIPECMDAKIEVARQEHNPISAATESS